MPNLAVPIPYTWQVGDVASAALLNAQARDGLTYMLNPPICELVESATAMNIPNNAWTPVIFADGAVIDSYGGYNPVGVTSRYVGRVAGWYQVCGTVSFTADTTGVRGAQIYKNGSAVQGHGSFLAHALTAGFNPTLATPTRAVYLNGTSDYVEVYAYQSSGGTLTTSVGAGLSSSLSVRWVHA